MSRSVYLETMGCQMNVLDSELVLGELLSRGFQPTDEMLHADVVVLNTCSVRQHAEDKVYSRLGQFKSRRAAARERIVAVIGCMAERDGERLIEKMPQVDILCGPGDLHRLPALVDDVLATRRRAIALSGRLREWSTPVRSTAAHEDLESLDSSRAFDPRLAPARSAAIGRFQAYVRITRGCNKWCTFCVVPMTRGPEVHRPPDQLVAEVRRLAATGVVEVTLLGQTVNHYEHVDDLGRRTSFAELLRRIHDEVPELPRLRFVTSFPRDFGDDALAVMAECPRICRYLHIPAQSGSDRVLRRMNRGYTVAQYRDLLERARRFMPDISLSGDMIVGFPGETEDDFLATLALLREARYKNCFVFKYSPRPGTQADARLPDDVPDEVKRRRNNDLLAAQAEISLAAHRELLDTTVEILVEGLSKAALRAQESEQDRGAEVESGPAAAPLWTRARGQLVGRTRGDQMVVFDGPLELTGRLVTVRVTAVTPFTLFGQCAAESESSSPAGAARSGFSLPVVGSGAV